MKKRKQKQEKYLTKNQTYALQRLQELFILRIKRR